MATAQQVGFSQRVQLSWLEYTVQLTLAGKTRLETNEALQDHLREKLSVGHQVQRGNREKAITILLKVWHSPPLELVPLRDEALEMFQRLPSAQHIALNWGMSMAVYPFFGSVAGVVGKLLRLQDQMSTAQVQRRIREQLGERETVARAARRIYRSFIDWHVLQETGTKGTYATAKRATISDGAFPAWMAECLLRANGTHWTSLEQINNNPSCFPFDLQRVTIDALQQCPRLEVMRHGMDQEMVRCG